MAMPKQPTENQEERRKRGRSNLTWFLLILTFLGVLAGPTMVVLCLGMLPTLVALLTDRSKQKSNSLCVGSINFIGVFPYIMGLWSGINDFNASLVIISDFFNLLVMYSAAAFGWFLFLTMPSIISSFVLVLQQRKVAQLRGEQKDLIDEWGAEVAAIVEVQKMEKKEHHMEHGMEM
ncbi:hypothetical protein [Magnetovibrio sp.]|uniref:hypothetical protein n=1 Tax=Magnetovibrio sp. TaxID=2024836 RepID=UPI002F923608